MISEREAVERERAAYIVGRRHVLKCTDAQVATMIRPDAVALYPMPFREVADPHHKYIVWRCVNGVLQTRTLKDKMWTVANVGSWAGLHGTEARAARMRIWADLMESPND